MSTTLKIDDYSLAKLSNEAENFKEDVQNILNYGKYSSQVVQNTPPAWTARNGEFVFFASGTVKRIYFYNISAWDYIEYNAGTVGGLGTSIVTSNIPFSGVPTMITGISFSMAVSETWTFEIYAGTSSGSTGTTAGQWFNINAPGGSTLVAMFFASSGGNIGDNYQKQRITTLNSATGPFFLGDRQNFNLLKISGVIQTGASSAGSMTLSADDEISESHTFYAGSYINFRKVV